MLNDDARKKSLAKRENLKAVLADYSTKNTQRSNYLRLVPALYQGIVYKCFTQRKSKALAIKAKCLDCSSYQKKEITNCTVVTCPLYNFRPYQVKDDK